MGKYAIWMRYFTDAESSTKDIEGIKLELKSHTYLGMFLNMLHYCVWMGENIHQL